MGKHFSEDKRLVLLHILVFVLFLCSQLLVEALTTCGFSDEEEAAENEEDTNVPNHQMVKVPWYCALHCKPHAMPLVTLHTPHVTLPDPHSPGTS